MTNLIADKQIGRTKPGDKLRVRAAEARVLVALKKAHLDVAPKVVVKPETLTLPKKGTYARRDMVAEQTFSKPVEPKYEPRAHFIAPGTPDDGKA